MASNIVSITSRPAVLENSGQEAAMLWMQIDGASGNSPAAARDQALATLRNAEHAAGGPNVMVVSATDKSNVNPNDTVSMTLIYVNVGTQSASGVMLKNPVPQGTQYVTASAVGEGMDVAYDRTPDVAGGSGEVSAVRWKMNGDLKPGEERMARFKAVVR
jgi:uncharacterized repeat protein (TIGR01451 family)